MSMSTAVVIKARELVEILDRKQQTKQMVKVKIKSQPF